MEGTGAPSILNAPISGMKREFQHAANSDNVTFCPPTTGTITEIGILPTFAKVSFVLCFETEPYWLFSLLPSFIDRIFINNDIDSFSAFHAYLQPFSTRINLYNRLTSRLGFNKFCFSFSISELDPSTIVLVSDSPGCFKGILSLY